MASDAFTTGSTQSLSTYSANWVNNTGSMEVFAPGSVRGASAVDHLYRNSVDTPNANQFSELACTVTGVDQWIGVAVRIVTGANTAYSLQIFDRSGGNVSYSLDRVNAGAYTNLATGTVAWTNGDILRLEVSGTGATVSLVMKKNTTQFGSTINDTNGSRLTAAGSYGLAAYNSTNTANGDNWNAGDLSTAAALAANATAVATSTAALTTAIKLAATASSVAASSAALSTAIQMAASANAVASSSAALTTAIPLGGAATAIATATASLNAAITLVASAVATAIASGTLTTEIKLNASAASAATATADLSGGSVPTTASDAFTTDTTQSIELYAPDNWRLIRGSMDVTSADLVRSSGFVSCFAVWIADTFADDQSSSIEVQVLGTSDSGGVGVRMSTSTADKSCYLLTLANRSGGNVDWTLTKWVNNVDTQLDTGTIAWTDGDVLKLKALGASPVSLYCEHNDVQFASYTDSASDRLQTGQLGIGGFGAEATVLMDDWFGTDEEPLPTQDIEADATAIATMSAALTTAIRLGANANSLAAATAALNTGIQLNAAALDVVSATASLSTGNGLAANALNVVQATAALTTQIKLGATAVDVATATGALTNWTTVVLEAPLFTGQGGILDPVFWLDSVPEVGDTLYYDATHITIYPNGEISSDTNNCSAVVQFNDGVEWVFGLVIITPDLVASAINVSSASAQLTTLIKLAAAANALASATAALTTGVGLAATAQDVVTVTGSLSTDIKLAAQAQALAGASALLNTQILLMAQAGAVATATADLRSFTPLSAVALASSAAFGNLSTNILMQATAQGITTVTAALDTQVRLAAAASSAADASANLSTSIKLAASATDVVTASANLDTNTSLAAAAICLATATAMLQTGADIEAHAVSVASAFAVLTTAINLFAAAGSEATATASLGSIADDPRLFGVHIKLICSVPV
jgi:trimeric autotransporter adhesin